MASGTLVGLLILSRNPLIQAVWRVYASVIMGVPSLLVIFLFYYGGSAVLEGVIDITPFAAGLTALVVVYTVYIAELVRGAVRNVPRGQFEASAALAIRPYAAWWHVIMPQAVRLALAGLITIWMVVLKDTALVSLAGFERPGGAREDRRRRHQGAVHLLHHRVAVLRRLQRADAARLGAAGTAFRPRPRSGQGIAAVLFDPALAWTSMPRMLHGMLNTVTLTVLTLVFGLALAMPITLARMSLVGCSACPQRPS